MKNSKAAYSYFAMHFPAASEGSSGAYENLKLTVLFCCFFSIAVQNHVRYYDYF